MLMMRCAGCIHIHLHTRGGSGGVADAQGKRSLVHHSLCTVVVLVCHRVAGMKAL